MLPVGVGSNLIVRDGGIAGVVIRLGRGFNGIRVEGDRVVAGRGGARRACGAQGGGGRHRPHLPAHHPGLDRRRGADERRLLRHLYRRRLRLGAGGHAGRRAGRARAAPTWASPTARRALPDGHRRHRGDAGRPARATRRRWRARMEEQLARRDASQPVKERTAGSTFRNPAGFSSTGRADDVHDLKAWKLIEDAGMRGATLGGAQMSPKHANFLINAGGATAADLENLGELVRKKVFESTGSDARVGNHAGRPTIRPAEQRDKDPTRPKRPRGQIEAGMSSRTAARIAVLMGGRSAEREVSLAPVASARLRCGQRDFEVVEIDAGPDLASVLRATAARRRLQRAARPLGRGRLRPGHPGMAADPLYAFRRAGLGAGDGQGRGPSRSSPPPGCRWRAA